MADRQRPDTSRDAGNRIERNELAAGRTYIKHRQSCRILLELRRNLQNDLVLIARRIDLRNLPGAISIEQRSFHLVHGQPESGNSVAIEADLNLRVVQPQVAVDVFDAGDVPHDFFECWRRAIKLFRIRILKRELVRRSGSTHTAEIDRWLIDHEHADARHLCELRPQAGHDLIDRPRAFGPRLQVYADTSLIRRAPSAPAAPIADTAAVAGDVGILRENRCHLLLMADHFIEADALNPFDAYLEASLILSWQEPLRHDHE